MSVATKGRRRVAARLMAAFLMVCALGGGLARAQEIASPPTLPKEATPEAQLLSLIQHSRRVASMADGRLTGDGAALLRALGARAQFVMIGEEHGNAGIAAFATALWMELQQAGYRYAAVEADPWVAAALERELRRGGLAAWTEFLIPRGGAAAPFFSWESEARWAASIVATAKGKTPVLWGLDQVFIGAAAWLFEEIAQKASAPDARGLAAALAAEAKPNLGFLGSVAPERLGALAQALSGASADKPWVRLVEAMIVSARIYRPFTGGSGEAYLANQAREMLMRRTFRDYYDAALKRDGEAPKVFLKFGASHAQRGASPLTQVQGLGGFLSEFAAARDGEALTILALCGPGGETANLMGPPQPCMASDYAKLWAFLAPHLEAGKITLFDLRTWRLRPRRWASLPHEVKSAIGSFDVLLFVPASPAAAFLPGVPRPVVPGQ